MIKSMRELFRRQDLDNEIISLRNSLSNHPKGLQLGLNAAHEQFLSLADGDGYARGCRVPSDKTIGGEIAYLIPAWVPVEDAETRIVEGVLTVSKITFTDFPLRPWHTYYDWNFYVRVDRQYRHLLGPSNVSNDPRDHTVSIMECEWDTGSADGNGYLPKWAWPQVDSRIWLVGRWIYDCGHPGKNGHKSEIHPPKAIASFRSEAIKFKENPGLTEANQAVLFIGRNGGYWRQPINDQNYAFDLQLPPKPTAAATPIWQVASQTGRLPVQPMITPYPTQNPRVLRVVIPLQGVSPHPETYGTIISGGWTDPQKTQAGKIRQGNVTLTKIEMIADKDSGLFQEDEWYFYIGINGRWEIWKSLPGGSKSTSFTVALNLHPSDQIHITACGFEADEMHDHMGEQTGWSWSDISNPKLKKSQVDDMINDIIRKLWDTADLKIGWPPVDRDENDAIGLLSKYHPVGESGTFQAISDKGDYRLHYTIAYRPFGPANQ